MSRLFRRALILALLFDLIFAGAWLLGTPHPQPSPELDAALLARGYPASLLACTSLSAKQALFDRPQLVFLDGAVSTADAADPQAPTLTLLVSRAPDSPLYHVICSYIWNDPPIFRLQDPITLTRDKEGFLMTDDSFRRVDCYDTLLDAGRVHQEGPGLVNGGFTFVTWYADLKGGPVRALYGHGEFMLKQLSAGSGAYHLNAQYIHDTPTVSVCGADNEETYRTAHAQAEVSLAFPYGAE